MPTELVNISSAGAPYFQLLSSTLTTVSGWTISGNAIGVANGGTGSSSVSAAQNALALASCGPGQAIQLTAAASGSTGIAIPGSASLNRGVTDFSYDARCSLPNWLTPSTAQILAQKHDGSNGWILQVSTTGFLQFVLNATTYTSTSAVTCPANTPHTIGVSITRSTYLTVGSITFTVDGQKLGTSVSIPIGAPTTVSNAVSMYIMGTSTTRTASFVMWAALYSRSLAVADTPLLGVDASDRWATVVLYTSDFSAGADGFAAYRGTVTGNIDGIGGVDNTLRFYANATNNTHLVEKTSIGIASGKRYRIQVDVYIPYSQTHVNGFMVALTDGASILTVDSPTLGAWKTYYAYTGVLTTQTSIRFYELATGASTFTGANSVTDDLIYIKNVIVTEIGCVADWDNNGIRALTQLWDDNSGNGNVAIWPAAGANAVLEGISARVRVKTQFDKTTDTVLASLADLTTYVQSGKSYKFRVKLFIAASAGGGTKVTMSGTATATTTIYSLILNDVTGGGHSVTQINTALGVTAVQTGVTSGWWDVEGDITVNAGGTLVPQFAQNASDLTSSVLVGSFFEIENIP